MNHSENNKKVIDLAKELRMEAWHEGFQKAVYGHTEHGHTVDVRQKIQNHELIQEKILKELELLLSEETKP